MLWEDKINTTYTSNVSLLGNFIRRFAIERVMVQTTECTNTFENNMY